MKKSSEKCPMTPDFIKGVAGTTKKQQPNNHVPNQNKARKTVI